MCVIARRQSIANLAWFDLITWMPFHRRVHFAELLIEADVWRHPTSQILTDLLRVNALSSDSVFRHRMFYALCCVREHEDAVYAIDGFSLANEHYEDYGFEEIGRKLGAADAVRGFLDHVRSADEWGGYGVMRLWRWCGRVEGAIGVLREPSIRRLDPRAATQIMLFLMDASENVEDDVANADRWKTLRERVEFLVHFLETVPVAYRSRAVAAIRDLADSWENEPARFAAVLEPYCSLLHRTCRPPFRIEGLLYYTTSCLTRLPTPLWNEAMAISEASLRRLDEAAVRKNDAWLIGKGLWSLCNLTPALVSAGLKSGLAQLLRAAHTLGTMSCAMRREVIASFTQHPLASVDPEALELDELAGLAQACASPAVTNPLSRRLREHLAGRRMLAPGQIDRDTEKARLKWVALQFDVLNQLALDRLASGLPAVDRTGVVQHALMIQGGVDEHRRPLRRLLRAYFTGNTTAAEHHPLNTRWLSAYPQLDPRLWTEGIRHRCEVAGLGALELAVERDPLEILRMGSYFGTCLGLGGDLSFSAVAVALDINKRVIYARNKAGRVVARQLVAMSDDGRLVCFGVYAPVRGAAIRAPFRVYDVLFAEALGVTIYEPADDVPSYTIATIVSRDFWDDGVWIHDDVTTQAPSASATTRS